MHFKDVFIFMDWNTAINVTFTGVSVVFGMLVLLVLVLMIFGFISGTMTKIANKKAEKVNKANLAKLAAQAEQEEVISQPITTVSNDEQIVAVISAAVAMMYENSGKKPVIKAIKKSSTSRRTAWASAGLADNTRSF